MVKEKLRVHHVGLLIGLDRGGLFRSGGGVTDGEARMTGGLLRPNEKKRKIDRDHFCPVIIELGLIVHNLRQNVN